MSWHASVLDEDFVFGVLFLEEDKILCVLDLLDNLMVLAAKALISNPHNVAAKLQFRIGTMRSEYLFAFLNPFTVRYNLDMLHHNSDGHAPVLGDMLLGLAGKLRSLAQLVDGGMTECLLLEVG